MTELVSHHTDSGYLIAEALRLDGVATYLHTIVCLAIYSARVRPYITVVARILLPETLVNDSETIKYAIAVVVKVAEVDFTVELVHSLAHLLSHIIAIHALGVRESDPPRHGGGDIELAVRVFEVIVAEAAYAVVALLVHEVVEIRLGEGGLCVGIVDEQHQQLALA